MKTSIYTICVTCLLAIYSVYLFTHADALVFRNAGEYNYSEIVYGLARYGNVLFISAWLGQVAGFFLTKLRGRLLKILAVINMFGFPCVIAVNVVPYTGILDRL